MKESLPQGWRVVEAQLVANDEAFDEKARIEAVALDRRQATARVIAH